MQMPTILQPGPTSPITMPAWHSGTLPATFTADELIRKGYLKGLNRSPFGQSYTTGIRRNTSTGRLEALTCSTGGENIKDDALRSIASLASPVWADL